MSTELQQSFRKLKHTIQSSQFNQAVIESDLLLQQDDLSLDDQLEALYFKVVALRYNSKLNEAINTLDQLFTLTPNHSRAHQELGYCYLAQNKTNDALHAFHKAIEFNPALIASWQQIVKLFKQQKNTNYQAANEQLTLLKKLPPPVLAAMDLMHEGKLHKAEHVCRQFLQQHKHQADAMCLLADIGSQLKVFDDAEFLLESCVNLYPENIQAKAGYINILSRLGKFKQCELQAEQFLSTFTEHSPVTISIQVRLANCYVSLGKLDAGIAIYQDILEAHPDRAGIYVQLGHAYKTKGDITKAQNAYQHAYQLQSDFGDAFWSLANIKTYQFNDNELALMKGSLAKTNVSEDDKIHINFALGKAYEDRAQYNDSFSFYAQGNALKKQVLGYDANKTTELINQQISHCTKALFEKRVNDGVSAADPIFIVGLPRAGSTLLEQIIASHSMVDGTMELHNILGTALKLRGRIVSGEPQYPKNLHDIPTPQLKQLGEAFLNDTQSYRQGAPFFIDKMPNNFIHIGLIKLMLPNAKIIDARREPMACCFSGFKQLFGEGQEFSYNLKDIAQYYRDYERLMAHWDAVLPGQVLRVQHEELVQDFEAQVRRILDYCQLPFEQSCIEFYNTKRNIHTPSAQQVRQPISTKGLTQWQHYQPYLDELTQALKR